MPTPTTSGAVGAAAGAALAAAVLAGGDFECPNDYRCTPKAALTQAIANPVVNDLAGTCLRATPTGVEACYERLQRGVVVDLDCKDAATTARALAGCIAAGDNCDRLADHESRTAVFAASGPICQPGIGPPPDPVQ